MSNYARPMLPRPSFHIYWTNESNPEIHCGDHPLGAVKPPPLIPKDVGMTPKKAAYIRDNGSPCTLRKLPPEVRMKIYAESIIKAFRISKVKEPSLLVGLRHSPSLHAEYMGVYWSMHNMHVDILTWSSPEYIAVLPSIKYLTIELPCGTDEDFWDSIQQIHSATNLRTLSINFKGQFYPYTPPLFYHSKFVSMQSQLLRSRFPKSSSDSSTHYMQPTSKNFNGQFTSLKRLTLRYLSIEDAPLVKDLNKLLGVKAKRDMGFDDCDDVGFPMGIPSATSLDFPTWIWETEKGKVLRSSPEVIQGKGIQGTLNL